MTSAFIATATSSSGEVTSSLVDHTPAHLSSTSPSRAGLIVSATALLACSSLLSNAEIAPRTRADNAYNIIESTSAGGAVWQPGMPIDDSASVPVHGGVTDPRLSDSLRHLRDMSGLTWDQVAKIFGVSRRAIHHWVNGGRMTARNAEILREVLQRFASLPAENGSERRSLILAPQENGYSLYDYLRSRYSSSNLDISGTPFSPGQLLGTLND